MSSNTNIQEEIFAMIFYAYPFLKSHSNPRTAFCGVHYVVWDQALEGKIVMSIVEFVPDAQGAVDCRKLYSTLMVEQGVSAKSLRHSQEVYTQMAMCALSLKHRTRPVCSLESQPPQSSLKINNMKNHRRIKKGFYK